MTPEARDLWFATALGTQIGWIPDMASLQPKSGKVRQYREMALVQLACWMQSITSQPPDEKSHTLRAQLRLDQLKGETKVPTGHFGAASLTYMLLGWLTASSLTTRTTLAGLLNTIMEEDPCNMPPRLAASMYMYDALVKGVASPIDLEAVVKAGQLAFGVASHANFSKSQALQSWWENNSPVGTISVSTSSSSASSTSSSASSLIGHWHEVFEKIFRVMLYPLAFELVYGGQLLVNCDSQQQWANCTHSRKSPLSSSLVLSLFISYALCLRILLEKIDLAVQTIMRMVIYLMDHVLKTHKKTSTSDLSHYVKNGTHLVNQYIKTGNFLDAKAEEIGEWLHLPNGELQTHNNTLKEYVPFPSALPPQASDHLRLPELTEPQHQVMEITQFMFTLQTQFLARSLVHRWFVHLTGFLMSGKVARVMDALIEENKLVVAKTGFWHDLQQLYQLHIRMAVDGRDLRIFKVPDENINKFEMAWPLTDVVWVDDAVWCTSNVVGSLKQIRGKEDVHPEWKALYHRRRLSWHLLKAMEPQAVPGVTLRIAPATEQKHTKEEKEQQKRIKDERKRIKDFFGSPPSFEIFESASSFAATTVTTASSSTSSAAAASSAQSKVKPSIS